MKKKAIFWIILIVVIAVIALLLYFHYLPLWVGITTIVSFGCSAVVGWIAKALYNKYIKG